MGFGKVAGWAYLALALACSDMSGEAANEATASSSQALDRYCKNATPVASFSNTLQYVSPVTYSSASCYKGQVVQLLLTGDSVFIPGIGSAGGPANGGSQNGGSASGGSASGGSPIGGSANGGSPTFGGTGGTGGAGVVTSSPDVVVDSPNPNLNTKESCEAAWLGGYRFDFDSVQGAYVPVDMKSVRGVFSSGNCTLQFTFSDLPMNSVYRFAVSARTRQSSSAPTQAFGMYLAP